MSSKKAGSTRQLVQQRTAAFLHKKKIFYVSSPQVKGLSNIEEVFLLGDQRYYNVPCPCCGEYIVLKWHIQKDGETAGITWKTDDNGNIIRSSVGYICQECGGFFNESHKYEMNLAGFWKPTVVPKEENHYSYQISGLYNPPGMDDWFSYVQSWLNANPVGGKPKPKELQTFYNVKLGLTYEETKKTPDITAIQRNIRNYKVGEIPEWVSNKDGNGDIVMITLAGDLNGTEQDARLDWEIVAWAESGASYSVKHGSIGTFVPKEGTKRFKEDRQHWTYEHGRTWSVWPELKRIIEATYLTDTDRKMKIVVSGIDTGHHTNFAFEFIDSMPFNVIGVRGDKESRFRKMGIDVPIFKPARERSKLYLLDVNHVKDIVSTDMDLKWVAGNGEQQPAGFMNYPEPSDGLYILKNYFSHYASEHRVIESKDGEPIGAMWVKKSGEQNHFWDVRIYNYSLRELWADGVLREAGYKKTSWADFVRYFKSLKSFSPK
jgi:phage terminase large subunit GpA-like protein